MAKEKTIQNSIRLTKTTTKILRKKAIDLGIGYGQYIEKLVLLDQNKNLIK